MPSPLEILKQHFHLEVFRKGQEGIIDSVIRGKDAMAVMPTGGGKSLCYQLPAVSYNGLVVVISPLIALMKDQVRTLTKLGIRAGAIHSGQDLAEKKAVFELFKKRGPFVLYMSPERVQHEGFSGWAAKQNIRLFAIDEAHCVSQWGPDFRKDYHKLSVLRKIKPDTPILALTATATPQVLNDIQKQLGLDEPDRHVHGFYRPNLYYQMETCQDENEKIAFLRKAVVQTPKGRILIYCGTRQQTETTASRLQREFEGVGYYHAGMSAESRKEVQEKLDRNDLRILAATNAFGMGIDYPDVRLVVHLQMPANIESLYQEMGRAGRDGQMSTCLVLSSKKDRGLHSFFIQRTKASASVIRQRWNSLTAITQFIESEECRHGAILTYFRDEDRIIACGHCDVCAPTSPLKVEAPLPDELPLTSRLKKAKKPLVKFELDSPEAQARALVLKDWRKAYARENDLPAFVVFSDKTLVDLCNKNPKDLEALSQVYGFGPAKIEQFGQLVLGELGIKPSI